jgi:predicted DNA-binding protein YlxM (UPF0122 family)
MVDDFTRISLLYDFYGDMLTKRQAEAVQLCHEENCSLSEAADELGISRQGVYDALHNAQKALDGYEKKLGLMKKYEDTRKAIEKADAGIDEIIAECEQKKESRELVKKLMDIKAVIDSIDE